MRMIRKVLWWMFHFNSQNLAAEARAYAEKAGRGYTGHWLNWRCWLYIGDSENRWQRSFRMEIVSGWPGSFGINASGDERDYTFKFWAFIQFYITLEGFLWGWCYPKRNRHIQVSFHNGAAWFDIMTDPFSWSSKGSKWRSFSINPSDIIFGRMKYKSEDIETVHVPFAMPEAHYTLTVRRFRSTWWRPRFPWWKIRLLRAEVEPSNPVPVPGKGENSWDCGDDAIHSLTTPAKTVGEAVGSFFDSVDRQRSKHGRGLREYADREPTS